MRARREWFPVLLAVIINGIVLSNAVRHPAGVGYDAHAHLTNIQVYPLRFPTPQDSAEYFSAPLSYQGPSVFDKFCMLVLSPAEACRWRMGKVAQFLNVLLSVGITAALWKSCEWLRPGSTSFKVSTFALLAVLTVYYRTFSQVRPEPYVAFFTCLLMLQLLSMLVHKKYGWNPGLRLGLVLGLLILSRQWGFFAFPALAAFVLAMLLSAHSSGNQMLRATAVASAVALLVGGWFYLHLLLTYGSVAEFPMQSPGFSISNQPSVFYSETGFGNPELFRSPVRPAFGDEGTQAFMPIFYSDTWGDYWCYFSCVNRTYGSVAPNQQQIGPFLGKVNLVSTYPTLLLLAALTYGAISFLRALQRRGLHTQDLFGGFLFCFVACSWIGYMIFQIVYPTDAATNKATYMIQIFMALPVLGGLLLDKIRERHPQLHVIALSGLALVFMHNLPALFTRWR